MTMSNFYFKKLTVGLESLDGSKSGGEDVMHSTPQVGARARIFRCDSRRTGS